MNEIQCTLEIGHGAAVKRRSRMTHKMGGGKPRPSPTDRLVINAELVSNAVLL
jgi:hypothetical protein